MLIPHVPMQQNLQERMQKCPVNTVGHLGIIAHLVLRKDTDLDHQLVHLVGGKAGAEAGVEQFIKTESHEVRVLIIGL